MILVFTGNGKGKTTAALGQAIRALGQGKRVFIVHFIKGPFISGEHLFAEKFQIPNSKFQMKRAGKGFVGIMGDKLPFKEHQKAAAEGLKLAKKAINPPAGGRKYDLIILDEINNAVDLKLIKAGDVLVMLKKATKGKDIILTGRNAPKSFIKIADIATEMKEIKHIFNSNKKSMKKGVEY